MISQEQDVLIDCINKNLNNSREVTQCFDIKFDQLCPNGLENNITKVLKKICGFTFCSNRDPIYGDGIDKCRTNFPEIFELDGALNLNKDELKILEEIVDKIENDELKSRIADLLFIREKHHKYANIAIESFLKIGRHFLSITSDKVPEVTQFFERFERAIQVATSIKNQDKIQKIGEELKKFLEEIPRPFKNDYLVECLLRLIKQTGCQDEFCLKFIEDNFNELTDIHNRDRIFGIEIEVAKNLNQTKKVNKLYRHKAQNLYEESNRFASDKSYIGAYNYLQKALADLKKINPKSPEDNNLEKKWEKLLTKFLKKVQEGSERIFIEFEPEVIEEVNIRLEELNQYNSDILTTLCLFTKDHLPEEEFFSQKNEITILDDVGKITVGNGAKEIPNSDSEKERAVQKFNRFYLPLCVFKIENLRKHIIQSFKQDDINQAIIFLIKDNPLLPEQKLNQIFQAIWFGFFGEWIISSYIIPAQIESMLRIKLEKAGIYSRKTDEENLTQQDRLLGKILGDSEYRKYLDNDELLGKNFIFHIEALLNHKHGANLRNEVYHGFCDDDFFKGSANIYLWRLFLKIIVGAKFKSLDTKNG